MKNPSPNLALQEKIKAFILIDLLVAEEVVFKQKSRVNWIQEGDLNTAFFHRMIRAKRCKNNISLIFSSNCYSSINLFLRILMQSGSLWVAWIQAYKLKNRSIWDYRIPNNSSWHGKSL